MIKTVITGIKPTGHPHIGNYFGAIKPAIEMSKKSDYACFYFIADYHSLTTTQGAKELTDLSYEVACTWLACGLDPSKVLLYKQSDIPEIFELSWILSNLAPKGLLNRAHAYKAMVEKNREDKVDDDFNVNMGLFCYPILMAADILIMNAEYVPVGFDQKQHVEIARDICNYFNKKYGETFIMPTAIIDRNVSTVLGTDGRKMSKSYNNEIPLFCDRTVLEKKIRGLKTDSSLPNEPKDTNSTIFEFYKLFATKQQVEIMQKKFEEGISWADAKSELFRVMDAYISPMREKYNYYMSHKDEVDSIISEGSKKARELAKLTITKVRNAIGVV